MESLAKYVWLSFFCIFLTGCQKAPFNPLQENQPSTAPKEVPVFEIRDFQVKKGDKHWFEGRGTVVTRDSQLQNKSIILVLKEKCICKSSDNEDRIATVYIQKGVGQITTLYLPHASDIYPTAPKYEWSILGWAELKEGKLDIQK